MKTVHGTKRLVLRTGACGLLLVGTLVMFQSPTDKLIAGPFGGGHWRHGRSGEAQCIEGNLLTEEPGATWYWMRSPEQEKTVVMGLFNKYCIRCHGVDGRGIWDIPGIPDFTNSQWQASRTDGQLARIILEGRGAVMPPFRGALSLEEAWAMARYLRTLEPGTEQPRPDFGKKNGGGQTAPAPKAPQTPAK